MTRQDYITECLSAWNKCLEEAGYDVHNAFVLLSKRATVNEVVGYYLLKYPYTYLEYWEGMLKYVTDEPTVEDGEVTMILTKLHNEDNNYIQIIDIDHFYPNWDSMGDSEKSRIRKWYADNLKEHLGFGINWLGR